MQRQKLLNSIQIAQAIKGKNTSGIISGKRTDVCTDYTRQIKRQKARGKLALISLSIELSVRYDDIIMLMDKEQLVEFLHLDVKKESVHEFFKEFEYLTNKNKKNE